MEPVHINHSTFILIKPDSIKRLYKCKAALSHSFVCFVFFFWGGGDKKKNKKTPGLNPESYSSIALDADVKINFVLGNMNGNWNF